MANRALAAKAERAARQRREVSQVEFMKPAYLATPKSDLRAMLAEAMKGWQGAVTVGEPGRYVAPEGKGHRTRATRCYGNGERLRQGVLCDRVSVVQIAVASK